LTPILLTPHTVHVWRANLDEYTSTPVLSPDEQLRAKSFVRPIHQKRFAAARSFLRHVLARYLQQPPQTLTFQYTHYGKPYLPGSSVYFNLSHSQQWALCAISLEEKIGIDIEEINQEKDVEKIAVRFFSDYENQLLHETPADKKHEAFFRIWTCKEAFIKAVGEGLSFPLKEFDVHIDEHSARLISIYQDEKEAQQWSCVVLDPTENYAATVVAKTAIKKVELFEI